MSVDVLMRSRHDALIYGSEEELLDTMLPFLEAGLAEDGAAVAVTTPPNLELLEAHLGPAGERLRYIDSGEWFPRPAVTVRRYVGLFEELIENGASHVRVLGEVRFGATSEQETVWTRYESVLNRAFEPFPAWVVCPYDRRALSGQVVADAQRTHPDVWEGGGRRVSTAYVPPERLLVDLPDPGDRPDSEPLFSIGANGGLAPMRRLLGEAIVEADLGEQRSEELLLATHELVANSLRHGRGSPQIALWSLRDRVVCEVGEEGPGPQDPLAGYLPPDLDGRHHGMGLWLIRQLCDAVKVERTDRGSVVLLTVYR